MMKKNKENYPAGWVEFMSDMQNYEELANHPHLMQFAALFFQDHFKTPEELGKYIEKFN